MKSLDGMTNNMLLTSRLPVPMLREYPDRVWCQIGGIASCERRVMRYLRLNHVPFYVPRVRFIPGERLQHSRKLGKMLFPGYIFAAVMDNWDLTELDQVVPHARIYYPPGKRERQMLVGELRFMKLVEHLNQTLRFTWESAVPEAADPMIWHDENGYGYVQLAEADNSSVVLFFKFEPIEKVLSFSMSRMQFEDLLNRQK